MNQLSPSDKRILKFKYFYYNKFLQIWLSKVVLYIGIFYKFIGVLISTHFFDLVRGKEKYNISKALRGVTFCRSGNLSCIITINYNVFSFLMFLILLSEVLYSIFVIKLSKKLKYHKLLGKFFIVMIQITSLFSGIIIEILSIIFYVYLPITDENNQKIVSSFKKKISIPIPIFVTLNSFSILFLNIIFYYSIHFSSMPLFYAKTPLIIFNNNKSVIFFISLLSNIQSVQLIQLFIQTDGNKLLLNIVSLIILFCFILAYHSTYYPYFSFFFRILKLILYYSFISSIFSCFSYKYFSQGMTKEEILEKFIFCLMITLLVLLLENSITIKAREIGFSDFLFNSQKINSKINHFFLFYFEMLIKMEKSNFCLNKILEAVEHHKRTCKNHSCPCAEENFLNYTEKSSQLYEAIYGLYEKEAQTAIGSMIKEQKLKPNFQITLTYFEFLTMIRKDGTKTAFLMEKYFKNIKNLPTNLKFCIYFFKKELKKSVYAKIKTKSKSSDNHSVVFNFSKIIKYEKLLSKIRDILFDNACTLQKICSLKKISIGSITKKNISNVYSLQYISGLCKSLNSGEKKLVSLIKDNFSSREKLSNVELTYLIIRYYSLKKKKDSDKNIPSEITDLLCSYKDSDLEIRKSFPEKNFSHPIIISNKDGKSYIIDYICKYICFKLGYSPKELLNQNVNIFLPNYLSDEHTRAIHKTVINSKVNHIEKKVFLLQKNYIYFPIDISAAFFPSINGFVKIIGNIVPIKEEFLHYHMVLDHSGNFLSYSEELRNIILIDREITSKLKLNFFSFFNINPTNVFDNEKKEENSNSVVYDFHMKYDLAKLKETFIKIQEYMKDDQMGGMFERRVQEICTQKYFQEESSKKLISDIISETANIASGGEYADLSLETHYIGKKKFYIVKFVESLDQFHKRNLKLKSSFSRRKKTGGFSPKLGYYFNFGSSTSVKKKGKNTYSSNQTPLSSPRMSVGGKPGYQSTNTTNTTETASRNMLIANRNNNLIKKLNAPDKQNNGTEKGTKGIMNNLDLDEHLNKSHFNLKKLTMKKKSKIFGIYIFSIIAIIFLTYYSIEILGIELHKAKRVFKILSLNLELTNVLLLIGNFIFDSCILLRGRDTFKIDGEEFQSLNRAELISKGAEQSQYLIEVETSLIKTLTKQNDLSFGMFLEPLNITRMNNEWEYREIETSIFDEVSLLHLYFSQATSSSSETFGKCHHEFFFDQNVKIAESPNFADKLTLLVIRDFLPKIIFQFQKIQVVMSQSVNNSYIRLKTLIFVMGLVPMVLLIFVYYLIFKRNKWYFKCTFELGKYLIFHNKSMLNITIVPLEEEKDICDKLEDFKLLIQNYEHFDFKNNDFEIEQFDPNNSESPPSSRKKNPEKFVKQTSSRMALNQNYNTNTDVMSLSPSVVSKQTEKTSKSSEVFQKEELDYKNLVAFMHHLKNSFPNKKMFEVIFFFSFLFLILLSVIHIFIMFLLDNSLEFGGDLLLSFFERFTIYSNLILYYKISVLLNQPNFFPIDSSEFSSKVMSNHYKIEPKLEETFFKKVDDSWYGLLLYLSRINQENIERLSSETLKDSLSKSILNHYIKMEREFNTDSFCVYFSLYYISILNDIGLNLKQSLFIVSKGAERCKVMGVKVNQGGLKQSLDLMINVLNGNMNEFMEKVSSKEVVDYDYFMLSNKDLIYANINVISTYNHLSLLYLGEGYKDYKDALGKIDAVEWIFIFVKLIFYFLIFMIIILYMEKNKKVYEEIFLVATKIKF